MADSNAEYLVVGGWAVGYHGEPRFTKDLDVLIGPSNDNLESVASALARFGAPSETVATARTLAADEFLFVGTSPVRIDILRKIDGIDFAAAFARRVLVDWDGVRVSIIGYDDLLAAKKAAGREKDLRDVRSLEAVRRNKKK